VGNRWVGSHGPADRSLSLRRSSRPLERGVPEGHRLAQWRSCMPGRPEGHGPSGAEIVNACGSPAWQALVAWRSRDWCWPEGHGPAEIVNACGSSDWQALGVWAWRRL
jgi:hypothetical protein